MYAYTTVNCVIWRRSRSEHVATVMITQSERIDVRYQCTLKLHKSMEYWYFMQTFGATAAALRQIYISGCTLSPNQTTDYYDYVLSIEDLWNSPSNRIDNNILPFHIKRLSTFFPLRSPSFWIHRILFACQFFYSSWILCHFAWGIFALCNITLQLLRIFAHISIGNNLNEHMASKNRTSWLILECLCTIRMHSYVLFEFYLDWWFNES